MDVWKTIARHSYGVILLENCLRQSSVTGLGREWGINGRYRSTECPRHRQFQPLVHRFVLSNACVPFLVRVFHYSYVQ